MARGEEEASTCRVERRRGALLGIAHCKQFVAAMSVEELRSFCQVPADVNLELLMEWLSQL